MIILLVILLIDKKEVYQTMLNFFAMIERQYYKKSKMVRSDNGTNLLVWNTIFLNMAFFPQTTCTRMPQQNDRVERKYQHLLNIAQVARFQGNLAIEFWRECVGSELPN